MVERLFALLGEVIVLCSSPFVGSSKAGVCACVCEWCVCVVCMVCVLCAWYVCVLCAWYVCVVLHVCCVCEWCVCVHFMCVFRVSVSTYC